MTGGTLPVVAVGAAAVLVATLSGFIAVSAIKQLGCRCHHERSKYSSPLGRPHGKTPSSSPTRAQPLLKHGYVLGRALAILCCGSMGHYGAGSSRRSGCVSCLFYRSRRRIQKKTSKILPSGVPTSILRFFFRGSDNCTLTTRWFSNLAQDLLTFFFLARRCGGLT